MSDIEVIGAPVLPGNVPHVLFLWGGVVHALPEWDFLDLFCGDVDDPENA